MASPSQAPHTDVTAHVWRQPISLTDIDWQGHVNGARMLSWLQDSWTALVAPGQDTLPAFVVARHDVHYLKPLKYRSWVSIQTEVTDIDHSSVTGVAHITDGTRIFVRVISTWVAFDARSGRPRLMTETERSSFSRYRTAS